MLQLAWLTLDWTAVQVTLKKHRAVEHVHFGFVGANVRQQHEDGVVLFFDVELQWANALQHASICIQAQANSKWTALKAVEAPASGSHVHTIQVTLHLMLHGLCVLCGARSEPQAYKAQGNNKGIRVVLEGGFLCSVAA